MKATIIFFLILIFSIVMFPYASFAQDTRPMVRLIYFIPKDRQPQSDIDAKLDRFIKDIQEFFADQMERHGFGRKTFQIETDPSGKAVVHRFVGQFTDEHYRSTSDIRGIMREVYIDKGFNAGKHIYFTVFEIDTPSETLYPGGCNDCLHAVSLGGFTGPAGGHTLVPVSGSQSVAAHELGHAFGLQHDFRGGSYLMSYSGIADGLSKDAAEWLDAHRAFNGNRPAINFNTTMEMLPPSLVSPPNAIRLRFRVSDPDGLHQVQLLTPSLIPRLSFGRPKLLGSKKLNEKQNSIVEFVTTDLIPKTRYVHLQIIDVHGNFTRSEKYPIDVAALLPSAKVVTIPDANLAAAVRDELGESITTRTMLNLRHLDVSDSSIRALTGLEHAHSLQTLRLSSNKVSDFSPLEGLSQLRELDLSSSSLSDVSPLSNLTQLRHLELNDNNISDVSPLLNLTQLRHLELNNNNISDVSPLSNLTQLRHLELNDNNISDVSPLVGMTQLEGLGLFNNNISDISPLAGMTQLVRLELGGNNISDVSPLAGMTQMESLGLFNNNISDVSVLSGLTQLEGLGLGGNNISDVSVLSGLTQLEGLGLSNNRFSDVSALSELTQLESLGLGGNNISDVSPLAGMTQMRFLYLDGNNISDVSPLAGMTQMESLRLSNNNISDMSPLVGLNLLGPRWAAKGLFLESNPLSYASLHTHIPAMQAKGVYVRFDNRAHPALLKISGDTQEGAPGTVLAAPFIVEAVDAKGKPMRGVSVTFAVTAGGGHLRTAKATTDATGKAQTLLTLGGVPGKHTVTATATAITKSVVTFTAMGEPARPAEDVNGDGVVNIQDLVLVASHLGQAGQNVADVNGDGVVNIQDLVLVAGELGTETAAPSAWHRTSVGVPSREKVEQWLTQAYRLSLTDVRSQRGIFLLERLLAALAPKETTLLANYPNPFNPETWIPYQLAKPAEITLSIYAVDGRVVRQLTLGHQPAGMYRNKKRAAYWDGRNEQGERVASGVYFYMLTAGDFSATRKLLIRK